MNAIYKGICRKRTGREGYDYCYLEAGHKGKCFSSFGRKMEYLAQEVLKFAGRRVVGSTDYEDKNGKVDFWLECTQEECFLVTKRAYVPVQFTVSNCDVALDRRNVDVHGSDRIGKGEKVRMMGIIIVWISASDLDLWEDASLADDARKTLALKITDNFLSAIDREATIMSYLKVGLRQPPNDSRFSEKSAGVL